LLIKDALHGGLQQEGEVPEGLHIPALTTAKSVCCSAPVRVRCASGER
jgi:hypothetical protein